jgi:cystathionine beta-synthase
VRQALRLMSLHDVSQLPVMDQERCVGSISDWALSAKSLADPKVLDAAISEVMEAPFPTVESNRSADSVVKLLSKTSPAVLVADPGETGVRGIVTRSDLLHFLMAR